MFFLDDGVHLWIAPVICCSFVLMLPIWIYLAHHNKYTHTTLYTGWSPVVIAMCISRYVRVYQLARKPRKPRKIAGKAVWRSVFLTIYHCIFKCWFNKNSLLRSFFAVLIRVIPIIVGTYKLYFLFFQWRWIDFELFCAAV